ncbi:MAG: PAS domain S-box protein, partial [Deltaproteobacteria bacterium]|nr:PAS domain S-box protein [Deltaproteobacteria bacterium]
MTSPAKGPQRRVDHSPSQPGPEGAPAAEALYRAIVTQAGDAVAVIRNRRFLLVNPSFCTLLGYRQEEISGSAVATVFPEREWERLEEWHQRSQSGEMLPSIYEISGTRKGGECLTLEASASDLTGEGPADLLLILRPIPERGKLESQTIQAHKMEAIGTLAGGIAHDFNN